MRLFTALDLPDEIIGRLDQLIERLKPVATIKWSSPANLHITTKFIGEWPEERLGELLAALRTVPSRPPLHVHVLNTGFFRSPVTPHSFWSGIEAPGIAELATDTDAVTFPLGIKSEKRPFTPHLTLARIKERPNLGPLRAAIAHEATLDFGRFEARTFFLYRSHLKPTGSVYTKLAEFPLTHT